VKEKEFGRVAELEEGPRMRALGGVESAGAEVIEGPIITGACAIVFMGGAERVGMFAAFLNVSAGSWDTNACPLLGIWNILPEVKGIFDVSSRIPDSF